MKRLVLLLVLGVLVGCGPSAQERYDAAVKQLEADTAELEKMEYKAKDTRRRITVWEDHVRKGKEKGIKELVWDNEDRVVEDGNTLEWQENQIIELEESIRKATAEKKSSAKRLGL